MTLRLSFYSAVFLSLLTFPALLRADSIFLTLPDESDTLSLGGGGSAYLNGAAGMLLNPASAGIGNYQELHSTYYLIGENLSYNSFQGVYHFSPLVSSGVFFSGLYFRDPLEQISEFNETGNNLNFFDMSLGASLSYRLTEDLYSGVTLRYFRFELGDAVGQGVGLDSGIRYAFNTPGIKNKDKLLSAGISIKNIGPDYSFYEGGTSQPQPLTLVSGVAGKYPGLGVLTFDYKYSTLSESSYHMGTKLTYFPYVHPVFGTEIDFSGISWSTALELEFGKKYALSALVGARFGGNETGSEYYFGVTYAMLYTGGAGYSESGRDALSSDVHFSAYEPNALVPFSTTYNAEKVQGVLLNSESAQEFEENIFLLKQVALQPEDEKVLTMMDLEGKEIFHVTDRKMGVWLDFTDVDAEDFREAWETTSTILEEKSQVFVLGGKDLNTLNSNANAPLKVEWHLSIRTEKAGSTIEYRTTLTEMYGGSTIVEKNFRGRKQQAASLWMDISSYYSEYFSNVEGFYRYEIVEAGQ